MTKKTLLGAVVSFEHNGQKLEGGVVDSYFDMLKVEVPGEDGVPWYINLPRDAVTLI